MPKFAIKDVNLGGLSDTIYQGTKNSVAEMYGFDIHSEPGIMKANKQLRREDNVVGSEEVLELLKSYVNCSDGNTYFFGAGSMGYVYKRTSAGVWSIVYNVAPSAGTNPILGAVEDQGYIYFATSHRIHRWQIGQWTNDMWSSVTDNWANFTNNDADFHPFRRINSRVYVGDGHLLHQIVNGVFQAAPTYGLDIQAPFRIKSLGAYDTDLLLGLYVSSNVVQTQMIRWNTYSPTFQSSDPIPEAGINSFIETDNYVLVSAGTKGQLYIYDGAKLEPIKKIPGTWGATDKVTVHPNASCNFQGLPLFGLSQVSGNPCKYGLYSFGGYNRNYPKVLNLESLISMGLGTDLEIGCVAAVGDTIVVTFKRGAFYGADAWDFSKKSSSYIVSRVVASDRANGDNYGKVSVCYRSLPSMAGHDPGTLPCYISVKVNDGDWKSLTPVIDALNRRIVTTTNIGKANKLQVKAAFNTSADASAGVELEQIIVD